LEIIKDEKKKVLADTQNLNDETLRNAQIQRNIASLVQNSPKESWQENRIRAFYEGNQYILFVVETLYRKINYEYISYQ